MLREKEQLEGERMKLKLWVGVKGHVHLTRIAVYMT